MIKKLALLSLLLAVAVTCGGNSGSPTSPSAAPPAGVGAAADGSTLKATAPTPASPFGNVLVDTLTPTLTVTNASTPYVTVPLRYYFQVMNAAGTVVAESGLVAEGGDTTSFVVPADLENDTPYTWRARAEYEGRYGPWSDAAGFVTPELSEGYLVLRGSGAELYDPLTNGETVGEISGPVDFLPDVGVRLNTSESLISYTLPAGVSEGEFSLMVSGIDEGSPGDKSKVMSMQEGGGDLTTNDYRFSVEKRGRDYVSPGVITFRIITGDGGDDGRIHDAPRSAPAGGMSDEAWYFFKLTWRDGFAGLEVRKDNEYGSIIWQYALTTDGHPYRPIPHVVHIGAPVGRGGPQDATIPGMIVKNVWVGAGPRPAFPSVR